MTPEYQNSSMMWPNDQYSPMWNSEFDPYFFNEQYNPYYIFEEDIFTWNNLYDELDQFLNQTMDLPVDSPTHKQPKSGDKSPQRKKKKGKSRRKIFTLIENKFKFSNQRYLLLFTLRKLNDPKSNYITWVKETEGTFEIKSPGMFAGAWGAHKNRLDMTYEKVARSFRYYYKCNVLKKVPGVRKYQWNMSVLADLKDSTESKDI